MLEAQNNKESKVKVATGQFTTFIQLVGDECQRLSIITFFHYENMPMD